MTVSITLNIDSAMLPKLSALLGDQTTAPAPAMTAPAPAPAPAPVMAAPAPAPAPVMAAPAPAPAPVMAAPAPAPAPVMAAPAPAPAPAPVMAAPTPAPAPVPTSPTPLYTLEDISNAGAALAQSGRVPELQALLAKYGTPSVMALPADQYAAFAADLKALGARI